MLRKRTRSLQKDQHQMGDVNSDHYSKSHALGRYIKGNSIFNIPCVFVGLGPKGLLDSDSVRSPTSPLDSRVLSNLGNNPIRSPRSLLHEGNQRSWDCCKVGLSIVESLEDCSKFSGKILPSFESRKFSLSPQMMIKRPMCSTCMVDSFESFSKSLPKDFCKVSYTQKGGGSNSKSNVLFEIGETGFENEPFGKSRSCSLDSCSPLKIPSGMLTAFKSDSDTDIFALKDVTFQPSTESESNTVVSISDTDIFASNEFFKSLSASEIELSEDYTRVISHGPNPKTTHFFGDLMFESHSDGFVKNHLKNEKKDDEKGVTLIAENRLRSPNQYPSSEFLSFCYHCNKKLEEGKDIYMYRGEKAFCSLTCRAMEIMIDEELEESNLEQIFETGIPTTT